MLKIHDKLQRNNSKMVLDGFYHLKVFNYKKKLITNLIEHHYVLVDKDGDFFSIQPYSIPSFMEKQCYIVRWQNGIMEPLYNTTKHKFVKDEKYVYNLLNPDDEKGTMHVF